MMHSPKKEHNEALQYEKTVDSKREDIQLQIVKSTPCFWKCIWHHGIKISGVRKTDPIETSQSWSVDKSQLCFTQLAEAKYYDNISWCHRRNVWCRELGRRENHAWLLAASESRRNEERQFPTQQQLQKKWKWCTRQVYWNVLFIGSCSMAVDDLKSFYTHS